MDIKLDRVEINKITFEKAILKKGPTELKVDIINAITALAENKCVRKMQLVIFVEEKIDTNIFMEMEVAGHFSVTGNFDDPADLSLITGVRLFPYLQSYIASITALAGITSLIIPEPEFK